MADIALENFKKNIAAAIESWKGDLEDIAKKLDANAKEIDKLEAIKNPSADEKKKLENCKKTRDKLRADVESANLSLKAQIIVLTAKLPDANKDNAKDLVDLPGWAKKLIKDKGVQVLKGVTLAPTLDIDFKTKKLKAFGIKITW